MLKWLLVLVGLVLVVGSAYGVRQSGVDLVELSGLRSTANIAKPEGQRPLAQEQQSEAQRSLPVEIAPATSAQLSDDISAIGTLLADESVMISSETSGRVAEILFKDGDTVTEGAPLFKLDADLANAALAEAKARFSLAETNFGRNQTLRKSGTVAQITYDTSLTELEVARAAVESAEVHLKKLTVAAPFPGTLGFRTVSAGAYVAAGATLVQLDKIDRLKVSFSVPELEQARIAVGQEVEVTADALPGETFIATISAIAPSIDVNGRALLIRADVENAAQTLRPGLLVRIIVKGPPRQAVLVPESAIVQRGDSSFVYLAQEKTAKEAAVRLGKRIPGSIEIVEGVSAGAQVIVAGTTRLSNGAAIEVVPTRALVD